MVVLSVHGLRNHAYESVATHFQWIAAELPESYSLLYIRDDEQLDRENQFSVYRLARGKLDRFDDKLFSPCIPIIGPPYEDGNT